LCWQNVKMSPSSVRWLARWWCVVIHAFMLDVAGHVIVISCRVTCHHSSYLLSITCCLWITSSYHTHILMTNIGSIAQYLRLYSVKTYFDLVPPISAWLSVTGIRQTPDIAICMSFKSPVNVLQYVFFGLTFFRLLSERNYVTIGYMPSLIRLSSVCQSSSVTFMHPT